MKLADEERELTRLLASERSPLGSSIEVLRDNVPDATELASLASRLALQGLDVTVQAPPPPARAWKKWAIGGAGGAAAVLVWLALRGSPPTPNATPSEAPAPRPSPATVIEQQVSTRHPSNVAGNAKAPAAVAAPTAASADAPSPTLPNDLKAPNDATAPVRPSGAVSEAARSAAHAPAAPSRPAVASVSEGRAGAPLGVDTATAPSEIELLRDARFALRQSPARALELTDQHVRLYPQGKLTQERELLAISALVALGRRTAALSRGASFERLFPASPYRKQVGDLLR